ncbi:MAG TPA: DUF3108 domain-containing protein [Bryobacteraceae bacterium]|jgi:hypothetical protein|nr:DUF3108 domain-containing protein [Bryobacteraceae bacterium]
MAWIARAAALSAILLFFAAGASPQAAPGAAAHETLDYSVEWRLTRAGTAKFSFSSFNGAAPTGASTGEVRLHLESAGLVSRLFRVNDDYTAMLGANLCAQNSFLAAHEGNRNRETRVVYDYLNRKAVYVEKDLNKNTVTNHDVDIPSCVHDVFGGLMVLRNLHLEPGKTAQIPISDGKKFVQAKVESQRREEIKTELGTFKTVRYEIFLFDNILYKRSGHLHVWLTDDDRRLPVQLQVRLQFAIGTITFRLEKEEK